MVTQLKFGWGHHIFTARLWLKPLKAWGCGEVMMPHYDCVTTHSARRSGITNMYLSHKFTIVQMMLVSGHKTQKTFMDYIKPSSDEIDAIGNGGKGEVL